MDLASSSPGTGETSRQQASTDMPLRRADRRQIVIARARLAARHRRRTRILARRAG
jgi:hypothetical protein